MKTVAVSLVFEHMVEGMGMAEVQEALTALRAAYDALDATEVDLLTRPQLLEVLDEVQTLSCQLPTQRHRLLARLREQTKPCEVGAKSWRDALMIRWRLSTEEAGRWLTEADLLAPRHALTGAPQPPVLPATAVAARLGMITPEHVTVIRLAMRRLPGWVDAPTRDQVEVDWVRHAVGVGPKELRDQVERTLFLLDQDGPLPDDAERARRRGLSTSTTQDAVAMTELKGRLTPQAAAVWEVLYARYAAPGMCNPADEHPCTTGTPTQAQIDADDRSPAQRRHDAYEFIGRHALDKGELGHLNGLPTSIVVRTTLQELHAKAGIGVTGGGTLIPISEVLAMAAARDTTNYLAVFDGATGSALNLYRTRRTASVAQRLMLIARDGGCTKPGCTTPAYHAQAHHARTDWTDGGQTNVDDLALACGPDNRSVGPGKWRTRITDTHDVNWMPPPHLDTGQKRVNDYHHPERLRPHPNPDWHPSSDTDTWWPAPPHHGDDAGVAAHTGDETDITGAIVFDGGLTEPAHIADETDITGAIDIDGGVADLDAADVDTGVDADAIATDTAHRPGKPEPPRTSTAA
jgi:hypothetical protein